jgi:hypothetical protein
MPYVTEYIAAHPVLSVLQMAFTIWMLVDAYRRQAEGYWYFIIFFVPVIGPLAYFFVVKVQDYHGLRVASFLPPFLSGRPSLGELRFRAEQTPTFASHLALAERLVERGEYEEALPQLEAAARVEPDHGQVLFDTARCHARLGQPELALPLLERLTAKEPRWSGYAAWYLLIEVRTELGDRAGAVESCRELTRLAPTLRHQCLLAEHLLDEGQDEEVQPLLRKALLEHQYIPASLRWRNRRWAGTARRLLRRAGG